MLLAIFGKANYETASKTREILMFLTNTFSILQTAEIAPEQVLGKKVIRNRKQLENKLRVHKRIVGASLLTLYAIILLVALTGILLLVNNPQLLAKGPLPYLGGTAFIALLAFGRTLIKDYTLAVLPLSVAENVNEDELARFIETLLVVRETKKRADKSRTTSETE